MPVLAFDVNETLLDFGPLDPLFGGVDGRKRWFNQFVELSFLGGITGDYIDYPTAQRAALTMLGVDNVDEVFAAVRRLPLHSDVVPALERLRAHYTLVALTNSPLAVVTEQMEFNGATSCFDAILSADTARALKPRAEAYQHVGATLGVPLSEVRLVAAHGWDIAGALAAGCHGAFVRRSGQALIPVGAQPDIVVDDLAELADALG